MPQSLRFSRDSEGVGFGEPEKLIQSKKLRSKKSV
jgi:hypothetical protein